MMTLPVSTEHSFSSLLCVTDCFQLAGIAQLGERQTEDLKKVEREERMIFAQLVLWKKRVKEWIATRDKKKENVLQNGDIDAETCSEGGGKNVDEERVQAFQDATKVADWDANNWKAKCNGVRVLMMTFLVARNCRLMARRNYRFIPIGFDSRFGCLKMMENTNLLTRFSRFDEGWANCNATVLCDELRRLCDFGGGISMYET
ncbi:hypothetical protein V8G54_000763 [Vigna mungo]|uniref:Uncharacterized protein n=1 Tax=Vigna mungo TaxID=3915 RepID=A0AAQ3SB54_VIGMU